jgi:hypothetical protein
MSEITAPPRYWIAINGSSCALSAIPWQNPTVIPTPQQLFGFPNLEEAKKAQAICLNKPIPEVMAFLESLLPDINSGRIVHITPASPDARANHVDGPEDAITAAARQAYDEANRGGGDGPLPGLPGGPPLH